ncbi:sodium-dependent phosphate transport protein 2B-like [Artemia franciscana]|uniref:Uncharacterized protein n=1 Tax=Artemia franciscana TaxID=6661 RepID=A0AA88I052_ARTSF|nr:hypothetical protein QYM36_006335 [Artemia franciscana]
MDKKSEALQMEAMGERVDIPEAPPTYQQTAVEECKVAEFTGKKGYDVVDVPLKVEEDEKEQQAAIDPWAIVDLTDDSPKWRELDCKGKFIRVTINLLKFLSALACLYLFVVSLDLLQAAFKLLGGKSAGSIFSSESLLGNPVVGVMLGILTTVLVQSSSTSTSIVVSMVAAGILTVQVAIPIIMGSNIGTSVTNTIVSFTQISNKNEFRRAFAGATVHDMFNWLTVIVLFTVEMTTRGIFGIGYLEFVSGEITSGLSESSGAGGEIEILKVITGPAVDLIVQLNKTVLDKWALGEWQDVNSLLKTVCGPKNNTYKCTISDYLFADTGMSDAAVGSILLVISLVILCICLVVLVKILNSILKGTVANMVKRFINADIPYVPWLTGYVAIFIGAVMTFLVQSSSVFTSALTPLVGVGLITIERVYPLTLGSNIGTTTTSLLAALAADSSTLAESLQISLCHLFFNLTGTFLFYTLWFMRWPIPMAKYLGNTTADYRWFAILYLVFMFFVIPGIVLALSLGGIEVFLGVGIPVLVIVICLVIISVMQSKCPKYLPKFLRKWPAFMTLKFYDDLFRKCACCNRCMSTKDDDGDELESVSEVRTVVKGQENDGFVNIE